MPGWPASAALVEERSQIALPRLLAEGLVADAAFVDGSHIFHNVFTDLFYLRELVRPGGLVILDDCSYLSVATAVRYFEVNTGWEPEPIPWLTGSCLPAAKAPDRTRLQELQAVRPRHDGMIWENDTRKQDQLWLKCAPQNKPYALSYLSSVDPPCVDGLFAGASQVALSLEAVRR